MKTIYAFILGKRYNLPCNSLVISNLLLESLSSGKLFSEKFFINLINPPNPRNLNLPSKISLKKDSEASIAKKDLAVNLIGDLLKEANSEYNNCSSFIKKMYIKTLNGEIST